MENGHGAAVLLIILLWNWTLLNSASDCLFISLGCLPCANSAAAENFWSHLSWNGCGFLVPLSWYVVVVVRDNEK